MKAVKSHGMQIYTMNSNLVVVPNDDDTVPPEITADQVAAVVLAQQLVARCGGAKQAQELVAQVDKNTR